MKEKWMLPINRISEKRYYNIMCTVFINLYESEDYSFESYHKLWFDCFTYSLRKMDPTCTADTVRLLFYGFRMENGQMFHKSNSPLYARSTKLDMLESFCYQCHYISDRNNMDRLIKTHWIFRQIFDGELSNLEFGED